MKNRCIFCQNENPESLTKEHIIPKAIGGAWTIPNASCKNCQKICNEEFENDFLKGPNVVAYQRSLWGLKGRNDTPVYGMPGHGGQMLSEVGPDFPKVTSIQIQGRLDAPPQIIFLDDKDQAIRYQILKSEFPLLRPIGLESFEKMLGVIPDGTKTLALYVNGEGFFLNIWKEFYSAAKTIANRRDLALITNSTPVLASEMWMPINHLGVDRTYAKAAFCYLLNKTDTNYWFTERYDDIRKFILFGDSKFLNSGNIKNHESNQLDPIYETIGVHPFTYFVTLFRVNKSIWSSILLPGYGNKYIRVSENYIPPKFIPSVTLYSIAKVSRDGGQAKAIEMPEDIAARYEELANVKIFNKMSKKVSVLPLSSPIFPVYAEVQLNNLFSHEIYPRLKIEQLGVFSFENYLRIIKQISNDQIITVGFDYSRGATLYVYSKKWKVKGKIPNIRSITSFFESQNGKLYCSGQAQNDTCEIWSAGSAMDLWTKAELPMELVGQPIIYENDETINVFGNKRINDLYVPAILESRDFGNTWNEVWQGIDPGLITSMSQSYCGTSGKPAIVYQSGPFWRNNTKIYISPSQQEERIQEISEFSKIVVAGINRFNSGGYCIYRSQNDPSDWKRTNLLPNSEDIVGVAFWKPELQIVCSKEAIYASENLGYSWKEIFRPGQNQEFFKLEKVASGDVFLLYGNIIWRLKEEKVTEMS